MVSQLHSGDENKMTSFCNSLQNTCSNSKNSVRPRKSDSKNSDTPGKSCCKNSDTPEKSYCKNSDTPGKSKSKNSDTPWKSDRQIHEYQADGKTKSGFQQCPEQCQEHPSHEYLMYCNDCRILVCVLCVNRVHKGHDFSDIEEAMTIVHRDIQSYQDELQRELSRLEHSLQEDDINLDNWCLALETEVNRKRNEVKKAVDIVCDDLLHRTIKRYKDEVEDSKKTVKRKVRPVKILLRLYQNVQSKTNSFKISLIRRKKPLDIEISDDIRKSLPVLHLKETDMNELAGFIGEFYEATEPEHQEDSMDERKEKQTCDVASTVEGGKYDQSFLPKLRNSEQSTTKPSDLPDIPEINLQKVHQEHPVDKRKETNGDVCVMERREYDRSFLLKFRFSKLSTTKPSDLPDLPGIILMKPHTEDDTTKSRDTDAVPFTFTPGYVISFSFPLFILGVPKADGKDNHGHKKEIAIKIKKDETDKAT